MNKLSISDQGIIKIIKNAFPHIFDTIRIEAKKKYFEIFGLDEAHLIFADLFLTKDAFSDFEVTYEEGISISYEDFKKVLEIASAGDLTGFESMLITMYKESVNFKIQGEVATINEDIYVIPTGITEKPSVADFSEAAFCELDILRDLRPGVRLFESSIDTEQIVEIIINARENTLEFKSQEPLSHKSFKHKGKTKGSGKTATKIYTLDNVTKVAEMEPIKKLNVWLINNGNIKFSYLLDQGNVDYVVVSTVFP